MISSACASDWKHYDIFSNWKVVEGATSTCTVVQLHFEIVDTIE